MAWDLVKLADRLKSDKEDFCLSIRQWKQFKSPVKLGWNSVPFCRSDATAVPKTRGVYAFIITLGTDSIPPNGYVTYVGETGNDSRETLQSRFVSYFSEMKDESRKVHYILRKYRRYLHFYFSKVPNRRHNLKQIEMILCDTLVPPYNVKDFSLEMRRGKKVL